MAVATVPRPLSILRRDRPDVSINMARNGLESTAELAEWQLKYSRGNSNEYQKAIRIIQIIYGCY